MATVDGGGGGAAKAHSIFAEPESLTPLLEPLESIGEEVGSSFPPQPHSPKQRRASMAKRLSGRASITPSSSLLNLSNPSSSSLYEAASSSELQSDPHRRLVVQVLAWLSEERTRLSVQASNAVSHEAPGGLRQDPRGESDRQDPDILGSDLDAGASLQKLEQIVSDSIEYAQKMASVSTADYQATTLSHPRRRSSVRTLRKASTYTVSSDTEYHDGDAIVPSADVILDNSKTLAYSGGEAGADTDSISSKRALKEKEGWNSFKYEIVRLTHTLRLKGWRRVPLEQYADIGVQRLSGALTNAVYVVSPPSSMFGASGVERNNSQPPKKPPAKLLLRIYGPNVEHLINRDSELQILRRLARKNIGPRLLGTFQNGRFEQYFNATTLTPSDLRNPDTSKQIAKRMRELHDGVELLPSERDRGPFVWQNWDSWVARCEEIITWLDEQIVNHDGPVKSRSESWKARGFVCGVEWAKFRQAVDNYRKWLDDHYGGRKGTRSQLVFAHNDTQYGNLLRIEPSGTSPLLLPANEHKQLVVIDFEYANANSPGLEFANHFSEWCYNYHSPTTSHVCNTTAYPSTAEQARFIKAYVQHVPGYNIRSPPSTPANASNTNTSSITNFMLDSRAGPTSASSYDAEEAAREQKAAKEVERLMKEARLWRVANSAMWVAWGIVQAKVPGMDEELEKRRASRRAAAVSRAERLIARLVHPRAKEREKLGLGADSNVSDGKMNGSANGKYANGCSNKKGSLGKHGGDKGLQSSIEESDEKTPTNVHVEDVELEAKSDDGKPPSENEAEEDFDYLGYAQDRAMFFWGDLLEFGLVKEDDLPEWLRANVKRLDY